MKIQKARQRKTKDPCERCFLHRDLCLCAELQPLSLSTRLCLLIHHRELKRTTNTGRLALMALTNSEMRVRGRPGEPVQLEDLCANKNYRTWLLYPSEEAREITPELVSEDARPVQLLVPDGNWRQASKVNTRHPELATALRVKLSTRAENSDLGFLRKEHMAEGMATLQAIAEALRVIEGDEVGERLRALYRLKLERTLRARGTL